jgi:hypothetical protein
VFPDLQTKYLFQVGKKGDVLDARQDALSAELTAAFPGLDSKQLFPERTIMLKYNHLK